MNEPTQVSKAGRRLTLMREIIDQGNRTHAILFASQEQRTYPPDGCDFIKADELWRRYRDMVLKIDGRPEEVYIDKANPASGVFRLSEGDPLEAGNPPVLIFTDSRFVVIPIAEFEQLRSQA